VNADQLKAPAALPGRTSFESSGFGPFRLVVEVVAGTVEELWRTGTDHRPLTRTLDLRGPPPRQLVLRGIPLRQEQDFLS
jgi:hypothetical protein